MLDHVFRNFQRHSCGQSEALVNKDLRAAGPASRLRHSDRFAGAGCNFSSDSLNIGLLLSPFCGSLQDVD